MRTIAQIAVLISVMVGAYFVRPKPQPPAQKEADYGERVVHAVEQIRHVNMPEGSPVIGGYAVGIGGQPHAFYLLTRYVSQVGSPPDFELMIKDRNPAVRIAGAIAIIQRRPETNLKLLAQLENDSARVATLLDCIPSSATVGEIVADLKSGNDFLGLMKQPPNHSPDPKRAEPRSAH